MELPISSLEHMQALARLIGERLEGGEVFELTGDVGSGKTTFTKGLAEGLGVSDDVQSPSFTISRTYKGRDNLELHHYDFYRLTDPGIMRYDLDESVRENYVVTVIEWAETVKDILPDFHKTIEFRYGSGDEERVLNLTGFSKEEEAQYAAWATNR